MLGEVLRGDAERPWIERDIADSMIEKNERVSSPSPPQSPDAGEHACQHADDPFTPLTVISTS